MKNALPSLLLYGAGGHGKVVADAAEKEGLYMLAGFLDDRASGTAFDLPVLGTVHDAAALHAKGIAVGIVSIGHASARKTGQEALRAAGFTMGVVTHPSAQVARGAVIGAGSVLLPGAIVGPDAVVGEGCIINTGASIDHDCVLGDYVHIAPGARLAGHVTVGAGSHIGIGSAVKEGVSIGKNVLVGAGSVVLKDLPDDCVAYGVPAALVRSIANDPATA